MSAIQSFLIIFLYVGIYNVSCSVLKRRDLSFYINGNDHNSMSDYELIYLPVVLPIQEAASLDPFSNYDEPIHYNVSAFGNSLSLKLKPNNNLVTDNFKVFINKDDIQSISDTPVDKNCHYLHKDEHSVAAFSLCQPKSVHALIFLGNTTLEINPLNSDIESHMKIREALEDGGLEDDEYLVPHIVKRAPFITHPFIDDGLPIRENVFDDLEERNDIFGFDKRSNLKRTTSKVTIEAALFFDEAGYKIFAPYFNNDERRITNMLLAYMNGVQALYHHPSLGRSAEIALVRLEIMKRQPSDMPHYDGERSKLLDSFCDYQRRNNPKDDTNPEHWDMALYVSGLDFFAYENGRKSGVTMGLATVGGVCLEKYNCVIAELGTTNVFGKPYPSAGFTSVYILAHEIGHNLGMHHDNSGNSCPKEGYIMSPSRGTNGETIWSTCSAEVMRNLHHATCLMDKPGKLPAKLNHNKFMDTPGQKYSAKQQCEILLRDKDAVMSPNQQISEICYNLQCKTPHRSGYYHAGPALEGTECGRGKWCHGGDCVKMTKHKPLTTKPGGWGPWKRGKCSSGCITKSKGFQDRRRECDNPKPVNTDEGCEGTSYDTVLCNDANICGKRKSSTTYASAKCREFSQVLPELDSNGAGLQAPHEEARPWMGCAIFCRRADSGSYYTPRVELNDLNVSPYFPDGTLCHTSSAGNYYCLHHHCLPENFQFTKTSLLHEMGEDIPISQNAYPSQIVPPELHSYLSLGPDGKPLQTSLKPNQIKPPNEADWETRDYVELPRNLKEESTIFDNQEQEDVNFIPSNDNALMW